MIERTFSKAHILQSTTIKLLAIYNDSHCPAELVSASEGCRYYTFPISHAGVCFPPFALMQKVEPKNGGCPDRSAQAAQPTHNITPHLFYHSLTLNHIA
jgi:hypothetical protein